jgi:hypothetical protein
MRGNVSDWSVFSIFVISSRFVSTLGESSRFVSTLGVSSRLFQHLVAPMTTDALVETNPEIASERAQKGQQATKTVLLALKVLLSCLYYRSVDDLTLRL